LSSKHVSAILAGIVIALMRVVFSVSLATLMFSGSLEPFLARGIAIVLITNIVQMIMVALFWTEEQMIIGIQDTPAVLIAVSLTSMIAVANTGDQFLPTVIAFIAFSTLITGVFLLLLGTFKLGSLVRYVPYPVIGGFLAGSGWLLAQGAFGVMINDRPTLNTLSTIFQPDQLLLWLPGIGFGLLLFFGMRRFHHTLTLPAIMVAGFVVFFAALILSGTSLETASANGFFIGGVAEGTSWQLPSLAEITQADWGAIFGQLGNIGSILILTAITLLLNLSGFELLVQRDMDLNRHLTYSGIANILSAITGGTIGFQSLSTSALQLRIGARGRLVAMMIVAVCLLVLVAGSSLLAYIPRALLGGLLLFMGLDLLDNWLIQGWQKFNRLDLGVVALILIVIALSGFLVGIAVGLVVMVISFVFNSSRTRIFHRALSGEQVKSRVQRSLYHQRILNDMGKHIYVLELQGFLFFGTANTLLEMIRQRVREEPPLRYLILDFKRVIDFDSSVVYSFSKAAYLAQMHHFQIIFSNLTEHGQRELARMGVRVGDETMIYQDLDYALELCENRLLDDIIQTQEMPVLTTLATQLAEQNFDPVLTQRLIGYMEKQKLSAGDYLIHQDALSDDMYFIESGQVTVVYESENHKPIRLNTRTVGTSVGELGFYRHTPRSASIIADVDTVVYRLDTDCFAKMKEEDVELLVAFHELMLRIVSERMVLASNEIAALKQ